MRPALTSAFVLLVLLTGRQRSPIPHPVSDPEVSHQESERDWRFWAEKGRICQTMIAFQGAFIREDADGCLDELTPDLRRRYGSAFRSDGIFTYSGKTGQDILKWSDSVRVEWITPPRAQAIYRMLQGPRGHVAQVGINSVDLVKHNG